MDSLEELRKLTKQITSQPDFGNIIKRREEKQFAEELLKQIEALKKIEKAS